MKENSDRVGCLKEVKSERFDWLEKGGEGGYLEKKAALQHKNTYHFPGHKSRLLID